jgi:hypothetical protein
MAEALNVLVDKLSEVSSHALFPMINMHYLFNKITLCKKSLFYRSIGTGD